jgi:heptosyltransferase-2
MKNTLIVKLNATGDVVRTTPLLDRLEGQITWISARSNLPLLQGVHPGMRCLPWEERDRAKDKTYELAINLEDETEVATFVQDVRAERTFGARLDSHGHVEYSDDARDWFDLSLISRFGRQRADELKLQNRRSYQEMLFAGMGFTFRGERYRLPAPARTTLAGDVAIAPAAGPVWPMKNWAYYDDLQARLQAEGLRTNVLPRRATLLEHLGDVANHRCLVSGDSLPMHLALGLGIPCVTLFNCTSPWEIHDYGIQTKVISPLLATYFYKRELDERATRAVRLEVVLAAVLDSVSRNRLAPEQAPR